MPPLDIESSKTTPQGDPDHDTVEHPILSARSNLRYSRGEGGHAGGCGGPPIP